MLVSEERGKPEYTKKNLSEQRRELTTNSPDKWYRRRDLNPDHIGGRRVLSISAPPCSPGEKMAGTKERCKCSKKFAHVPGWKRGRIDSYSFPMAAKTLVCTWSFQFIFVDAKKPQENFFHYHRIRCNCSAMLFSISHHASLSCLQVLERDTDLTG